MNRRISVAVTDCMAAIALSVPPVAFATKGGVPHSTQPCPTHRQSGKHNGSGKGQEARREPRQQVRYQVICAPREDRHPVSSLETGDVAMQLDADLEV